MNTNHHHQRFTRPRKTPRFVLVNCCMYRANVWTILMHDFCTTNIRHASPQDRAFKSESVQYFGRSMDRSCLFCCDTCILYLHALCRCPFPLTLACPCFVSYCSSSSRFLLTRCRSSSSPTLSRDAYSPSATPLTSPSPSRWRVSSSRVLLFVVEPLRAPF